LILADVTNFIGDQREWRTFAQLHLQRAGQGGVSLSVDDEQPKRILHLMRLVLMGIEDLISEEIDDCVRDDPEKTILVGISVPFVGMAMTRRCSIVWS
jgi:hypothetical protein